MTAKHLIVQADDFGMCHAVNRGIAESFRAGILTQASMMAPCPWIAEAAALARELALPIGAHGTLTCEWDYLRWRPDSIAMMSPMPAEQKKPWLLERLEGLEPGVHLIVTHPAVDSPELRSIARADAENYCWAEENRTSDLAVLLDSEVASRIESLGIELVSVADL